MLSCFAYKMKLRRCTTDGAYSEALADVRLGAKVVRVKLPGCSSGAAGAGGTGAAGATACGAAAAAAGDNGGGGGGGSGGGGGGGGGMMAAAMSKVAAAAAAASGGGHGGGLGAGMTKVYLEGVTTPLLAHVVLCTLPLGVLQHGNVEFSPPLPAFKQKSINALGRAV